MTYSAYYKHSGRELFSKIPASELFLKLPAGAYPLGSVKSTEKNPIGPNQTYKLKGQILVVIQDQDATSIRNS